MGDAGNKNEDFGVTVLRTNIAKRSQLTSIWEKKQKVSIEN